MMHMLKKTFCVFTYVPETKFRKITQVTIQNKKQKQGAGIIYRVTKGYIK